MGANYKAKEYIVVNNNFSTQDPLTWAYAFSSCSIESAAAFDAKRKLVLYNNKFGTLNDATRADLMDIHTLFRYYGKFYRNAQECLPHVLGVFLSRTPVIFTMDNYSGWSANCRAVPVLEGPQLSGVVLLAHRQNGAELQGGECYCE